MHCGLQSGPTQTQADVVVAFETPSTVTVTDTSVDAQVTVVVGNWLSGPATVPTRVETVTTRVPGSTTPLGPPPGAGMHPHWPTKESGGGGAQGREVVVDVGARGARTTASGAALM